ncbi:MAG: Arm DNA-binding domain-containing protein [Alistipes senegalensis]
MDTGVNILCYKSKTLANGAHPLMIRVCKDGKKKYVSLGVSVLPQFWDLRRTSRKRIVRTRHISKRLLRIRVASLPSASSN